MQAFVPDYDCDLLISFSRAGASLAAGEQEEAARWAKEFVGGLQSLLAQKLGRRDWGVMIAPSLGDAPRTDGPMGRCAAVLIILTRDYLRDESCLTELNAFLASLGGADATSRAFLVLAEDIERELWPAGLQSHLAFDFLTTPGGGDAGQPAKRDRLQLSDKAYPVRLDDLSTDVAICLERLKDDAEGKTDESPTVFLGTASPDVVELRDGVRRYLIQEGFRILPNRWYPQDAAAFREAALHDMRGSQLLVQLLGAMPFPALADSPMGLGSLEVELAAQAGLHVLGWREARLDPRSIGEVAHRRLLEGDHVLAVGIEEFKRKVVERAHTQAKKPSAHSDKPLVVVAASPVDRPIAQRLGELMGGKGLGIEIPHTEEFPWELYSNGKQGVGGLVIVYGACPVIWVRQQLWKYRKAMARVESRPPLCAVCEGPPEAKEPLRYDVPQMDLIDCRIQLTEAALSSFIEAVQRRCSQ